MSGASRASPDQADLVVVNTCSVTASADQVRGRPSAGSRAPTPAPDGGHRLLRPRRPHESGVCRTLPRLCPMTTSPGWFSCCDARTLSVVLTQAEGRSRPNSRRRRTLRGRGRSCGAEIEPGMAGRTAFTLRVQTGCAEPCSYCIIPPRAGGRGASYRGCVAGRAARDRGRLPGDRADRVHLGSYGRDLTPLLVVRPAPRPQRFLERPGPDSAGTFPDQLFGADGLCARDRGARRRSRVSCASFPPAAAVCQQADA